MRIRQYASRNISLIILTALIAIFSIYHLSSAQITEFSLMAPSNSSEDVDIWPDFIWQSSFDSSGIYYSLHISTSPQFAPGTYAHYDSLIDTVFRPSADLAMNSLYYWRVLALSGNGDSLWNNDVSYPMNFWQFQTIPPSEEREIWAVSPLQYSRTLVAENSPYIVRSGNLIIPAGKWLKAEPGVTIKIEGDYSIGVHGRIEMRGTSTDSIYITTADEGPPAGNWGYIAFYNAEPAEFDENWNYESGSAFEYVNFRFAESDTSTIWSDRTPIYVGHCTFIDNSSYSAIRINFGTGSYLYSNNISGYSRDSSGSGIDCAGSFNRIELNDIYDCTGGIGLECSYDHNLILFNHIQNCTGVHSGGGMFIYGNGHRVQGNTIVNCYTENDLDTYGGGLYFKTVDTGDRSMIADNFIGGCHARSLNGRIAGGGGMYICGTGDSIINNTITQNYCESDSGTCFGAGLFGESGGGNIIRGNRLDGNYFAPGSSNYGGGMAFNTCDDDTLLSNTIIDNDAVDGDGGGIYHNGKAIYVDSCIISGNRSGNGAGIYQSIDGIINHCVITNNEASVEGGGVFGYYLDGIYNSTIKYNSTPFATGGGGIYGHAPEINFCNISNNSGYDLRNDGGDIDATNNWWFTRSDQIAIEEKIWDGYDIPGQLGIVTYQPFLTDVSDSTPGSFTDAYYIKPMEDDTTDLISIIGENDTVLFELAGMDNNAYSRDVAVIKVINWSTFEYIRPFYEETGDSSGLWKSMFYLDTITVLPDKIASSNGDIIEVLVERDPAVKFSFIVGQGATSVDDEPLLAPGQNYLAQNYPNPFNPTTIISYELNKCSDVVISIYNMLGQKVKAFTFLSSLAGMHDVRWNGEDANGNEVSAGIYFYRIKAGDFIDSKKMILLK